MVWTDVPENDLETFENKLLNLCQEILFRPFKVRTFYKQVDRKIF